jgi:hypothetical protein
VTDPRPPAWLLAEQNGSDYGGPGSGWDPLWQIELDEIGSEPPGRLPAPTPRITRRRPGHGTGPAREAA